MAFVDFFLMKEYATCFKLLYSMSSKDVLPVRPLSIPNTYKLSHRQAMNKHTTLVPTSSSDS